MQGGNGELTLAALARDGLALEVWCGGCGRVSVLSVGPVIRRLGEDTALSGVARHLVCQACGARRAEARPLYPGLGVVANHRWQAADPAGEAEEP